MGLWTWACGHGPVGLPKPYLIFYPLQPVFGKNSSSRRGSVLRIGRSKFVQGLPSRDRGLVGKELDCSWWEWLDDVGSFGEWVIASSRGPSRWLWRSVGPRTGPLCEVRANGVGSECGTFNFSLLVACHNQEKKGLRGVDS